MSTVGSGQAGLPFDVVPVARIAETEAGRRSSSASLDRVSTPDGDEMAGESAPLAPATFAFVRHPRARRYLIRVLDDGSVRVTLPRWGSLKEARRFADGESAWIARQRRRVAASGLRVPSSDLASEQVLRAHARQVLPRRLLELATRFQLSVRKVSIRSQRWRWGSCSASGHICLNWRLVAVPDWVRDYVLIHELMHLQRMDHSPRFWALVADVCPEYREARAWLRQQGRIC
jgi:predicted metal-dependent hydrolase